MIEKFETPPELYAVRSRDGKWFRRKGYGGGGDSWVDDVLNARIYTKIGHARRQVTFWSKEYPEFGVPSLVKLKITEYEVIDETERVKKSELQAKKKKENQKIRTHKYNVERAQQKLNEAQQRLTTLERGK